MPHQKLLENYSRRWSKSEDSTAHFKAEVCLQVLLRMLIPQKSEVKTSFSWAQMKFYCQWAQKMDLSSGCLLFSWIFFFNFLLKWGFLSCNLGFSPPCESAPHYSQKQPFYGGKATLPTQEPANCLLLLDLSFYGSFKLFHIIRPQEMQLGPWPWEVGGFNASLQLQRGVSDAREAFSQQGHLVSSCHWRLKIRLPFHNP